MTLCDLQKKRINAMQINDSETVHIKRKRELFSQKARGTGARGGGRRGGRQQFKEISSDSESESDGAINKRLKKANRGRGSGKGRGKTSQSRSTEANVLEQHVEEELSYEIPMIIHDSKRNNVPKAGTSNDHEDSLNISNTTLNDLFPIDGASEIEMEDGTTISFREFEDVFEQHMDDSEEVQATQEIQANQDLQATEVQATQVQATQVQTTQEGQPIPAAQLHKDTRNVPKENDFVRVKFVVKARGSTKEQYFIGQVVELIDGEPVISFLKDIKDSELKQWPDKTELSLVDPSMITDILKEPETVLTGRRLLLKFN